MPRKHHRYASAPVDADQNTTPLICLWLLRILQTLGVAKEWVQSNGFRNDSLALVLNLGHWLDESTRAFDAQAVRQELRQLHQEAECNAASTQVPATLRANVERLAALVNLSSVDCRILEFACCIHADQVLDDTADRLGEMTSSRVAASLAVILDLRVGEVRAALAPQGVLGRSGLVALDRNNRGWLRSRLDLISKSFADQMFCEDIDLLQLLRGTVNAATAGQLQLADFAHVQPQLNVALPYLRQASDARMRGVNLFVHGAPGTGKSELARTVAQALGLELFEVSSEDEDGDPINAASRLRAFRAAQCFFAQRRALLVFDEAEDVFNDGDARPRGGKSTAQSCKAWVNRMLEDNPVPTLWLSNSGELDAAFIRRFDMVFELPVPPRAQRQRIVQQYCGGLAGNQSIARLSELEKLAPAVVARAARVVRSIQGMAGTPPSEQALERLISNTLQAQGHAALRPDEPMRLPEVYDPAFIHADADLAAIAQGIAAHRSARLCLYGPPGTGKTAYGRWLAQALDMPLLVKRASDLQSMWVGECEKNIARAFREAEQDGALLLIDEVDSFLQDRRGAKQSWEVSQVNEMLTQMEAFGGVFIASTNLMQGLDAASLRRFDLKVKLDYLRPEQAWALLQRHCAQLGLAAPGPDEQARMGRLRQLAPGDFAAVLRQSRFNPLANASALAAGLEAECALKEGSRAVMGFV